MQKQNLMKKLTKLDAAYIKHACKSVTKKQEHTYIAQHATCQNVSL